MKKTLLLSLLVAASTSITALADGMTLEFVPDFGPYRTGGGGEFTVIPSGFSISESYVPGVTRNVVPGSINFQTFCVEYAEGILPGTYNVTPNTVTVASNHTLNKGTAWLYEQFAAGTLAGYDYANPVNRLVYATALQHEIWYLMGDYATPNALFDGIVNSAAQAGGWNVLDPSNSAFSKVGVLNVWKPGLDGQREGRTEAQDVLYIPGVPDGGLTLALLGMGLTGVGMISRRARK